MKMCDMSIEQDEEMIEKEIMPPGPEGKGPRYPWGLQINLDEDALEKLGINKLPSVGDYFIIQAKACVTSTHESKSENGSNQSLALQIEEMGLAKNKGKKDLTKLMYANSDEE